MLTLMTTTDKATSSLIPVCAGLCLVVGFLCVSTQAHGAKREIQDLEITQAVDLEFWQDDAVAADQIDVKTQKGIVTLTGEVDNILARDRAEKIAHTMVGVRGVVNRLSVKASERTDREIQEAVEKAWLDDPAADSYELNASVKDGTVRISGAVDSWQEMQLAIVVAKSVKGVRKIDNAIDVNYKTDRSDWEIETEAKARLANDVRVDDFLVEVKVKDAKVFLSGVVGSLAEKYRALSDVWVGGVKSVDTSKLAIEWWARDKMRRRDVYVDRTDEEILKAVKAAFLYDPRVISFAPVVEVSNGTVTLSGVVNNLQAKNSAGQDARNVAGVWRVKNNLKVRPMSDLSNEALEKRVKTALLLDPIVEAWEINVKAVAGTVYLSGMVGTWYEKYQARHVAEGVKGVVSVFNNVTYVTSWLWKADWEIFEDVEDQLFWSPYVDEDDINVTVRDGVVSLTGTVDTWTERMTAEENAYDGGAKDVVNHLTVTHHYYGPYRHGQHEPHFHPPYLYRPYWR